MRRTGIDPSSSPAAAFGVQLRRSREAKKLTQVAFAELIKFSDSWVSCIERATRSPTYAFATRADDVLETGGTLELMWWNLKHTALLEGFPEYAAHEQKAAEIRLFESTIVPGLLQTPAYAAALATAAVQRGSIIQDQADERIDFLMTRQRLLERAPAPLYHAILDESCLRRPIGGIAIMMRQLQHLEDMASRPNLIIQVAPYSLAEHAPFRTSMTLLTLADRAVLGYSESLEQGYVSRTTDTVRTWERTYHQLVVEALSQAASLAMIRKAREELHP
ncbi:Scr1 family TA system antitoxin-like transcriptional regulator [Kitasatospora sp. NPDC087315]|uniref:helix-turn-helix domain-containing protein n=1 Tax=Kitasatospora sp. NPDC087315 TaxID=3364069 RepID=UPI003821D2FA